MLADQLGLELPGPVPRHVDAQRPVVGEHRLAARAVPLVVGLFRLGLARAVAQVMTQLGLQRPLDQGLLDPAHHVLDSARRHRTGHHLIESLLRTRRQLGDRGRREFLFLPWHNHSFRGLRYASNTKVLTGSMSGYAALTATYGVFEVEDSVTHAPLPRATGVAATGQGRLVFPWAPCLALTSTPCTDSGRC